MISVIIPTYNRDQFLEQAVRSVLEQTYPCDELLIVDDGSTDDTEFIVRKLKANSNIPIRYFFQENKGAAAARNLGIKKAEGELLCFLDSDDRFRSDKLALQLQAINESDFLISHTGEKWLRRGQHLNQKHKHQSPDGYIFPACLPMCVVGMSTVITRRELFERYGMFDESLPCCEDYDFWLRVSVKEEFKLVPQPLTVKNGGRDDQLSVIHRVGMDRYRIQSLRNLLENISLTDEQYELAVTELENKCEVYGNGCIKHGREEEGQYYLQLPKKYFEKRSQRNLLKAKN